MAARPSEPEGYSGSANASGPEARRLLQVLADTEGSDQNLAALQLHRSLSNRGWAVRTLALAPGRQSELAETIPVMAPTRLSLTAIGQFRTEQAWADVVLLRGLGTAGVARAAGTWPNRILALWSEPDRWARASRISKLDSLLLRSVRSVVVNSDSERTALERLDPTLGEMRTIGAHMDIPDGSAVAAARTQAGVGPGQIAIRLVVVDGKTSGNERRESEAIFQRAVKVAEEILSRDRGTGEASFPSLVVLTGDDEASVISTDVAVVLGATGGPSLRLLEAMANGSVVLMPEGPGSGGAITSGTNGILIPGELSPTDLGHQKDLGHGIARIVGSPDLRRELGAAAIETVKEKFAPDVVLRRWMECLIAALPSRP